MTGGGSGIGSASALAFIWEGTKVVVADVNPVGGEETLDRSKEMGGEAIFVRADGSSAADVEAMVSRTVESYGGVDSAFNNAGISVLVLGADARISGGDVGPGRQHQHERRLAVHEVRGTSPATAWWWYYRQYRVNHGLGRVSHWQYGLQRQQTRGGRDDQNCGD